ncbi:MAG: MarR family winged helix-turn-helix transcriptional regulator [Anaerolineales bacterium]
MSQSSGADFESMGYLLGRVCRLHHSRARELLEGLGLYRGQPPLLHALHEQEGLTHSDLAERLHVTPATITKMIRRMERAGFVQREHDVEDQRVSRVYLTEAGRAIQTEMMEVLRELDKETFHGLTETERALLRRFLLKIRDNLSQ